MNKIRKFIKNNAPGFLVFLKNAIPVYYYDLTRYYKYSASMGITTKNQYLGQIIKTYHVIEKGLTMPEIRLGFGQKQLSSLIKLCINFCYSFGKDDEQFRHAIGVINEYKVFHQEREKTLEPATILLLNELDEKVLKHIDVLPCKQISISSEAYFKNSNSSFDIFSKSRHSVRNYSNRDIPLQLIKDAIGLSRNTPSACNRQTVRVYVYSESRSVQEILTAQEGNRGFGHLATKLIVVTADLSVFIGLNERNQAFIDGGMFAMNLLYSLHSKSIAACILNCSVLPGKDKKLRELTKIKESEVFIGMISCGYLPDNLMLATSLRNDLDSVINIVN